MKTIEKKNIGLFFLMIVILTMILLPLFWSTRGQKVYDRGVTLNRHWEVTINGKTYENVTLSKFNFSMVNRGDVIELSHHMTEHYKGMSPVLKCEFVHSKIEVHMNDKLIYSYGQKDYLNGKLLGFGVHYIEIPNDYLGKTLRITLSVSEDNAFRGFESMELGNEGVLIQESIVKDRFRLAVSMALIVFGILLAVVAAVANVRTQVFSRLYCVALFSLLIGCWTLCNSNLIIYFTHNLKVKTYMEYLTLYAGALPLLCYFYPDAHDETRPKIFKSFYQSLLICQSIFLVAAVILQVFNLVHLPQELIAAHVLMGMELLFIILMVLDDIRCHRKYDRAMQVGMIVILLVIVWELARYNLQKYGAGFADNEYKSSVCYGAMFVVVALILDYTTKISRGLYRQAQQTLLENLAYRDELTGLYNRRKCDEVVEKLLDERKDFVLLSMDLNLLKYYNDTYGHEKGDELLRSFAKVLREAFPDALAIARAGGDEFTVVLPAMKQEELKEALMYMLQCIYLHNEEDDTLHLSTAVGIVMRNEFPGLEKTPHRSRRVRNTEAENEAQKADPGVDIRMLYQEADRRMYQHKQKMKAKNPDLYRR